MGGMSHSGGSGLFLCWWSFLSKPTPAFKSSHSSKEGRKLGQEPGRLKEEKLQQTMPALKSIKHQHRHLRKGKAYWKYLELIAPGKVGYSVTLCS